ncbi:MAG: 16S rRNA (uracil(1498)-N(3))-methyltransferase [Sulfurimonas sp.]|nr:16S rRNA (uracil(1498)-N(3))-methyltransferase [Sulfurimonas sp.]
MDVDVIYILNEDASKNSFTIKGELFKYLIKVRRHSLDDEVFFRNPKDIKFFYKYKIVNLSARFLEVELISSELKEVKSSKSLHIGWCVIDGKSIEKVLPSLNEIGVDRISFIYCERSQKNFKLDFKRFERILESSMQQCGRSSYMKFDIFQNIKDFITKFPSAKVFDFCDTVLEDGSDFDTVLIGCEGGFSLQEKEFLKNQDVFRLDTPMVLRSESAVVAIASKILL